MQGLVTRQGFTHGTFFLQGIAQLGSGLADGGLNRIEGGHRGEGGRRWLAIGFRGAPPGGAITLGGEQVIQRIERKQLPHPGAFAGDQVEFVAIVLADHPQAAGQRQDKQQKQQLEFTCEAKTPQQPDPR
ncbi:hypothetical protein D3C86_1180620 [compost metagenome]